MQGLAPNVMQAVVSLVATGSVAQALLGTLLETLSHVLLLESTTISGVDLACALASLEDALLRDAPMWTAVVHETCCIRSLLLSSLLQ